MKLDFDGSVTVLTADDIRLSGAASLTDVLRRVVGVSGEKAVQAIDAGQRLIDLSYAAYLHDVGKVKVPDGILNKAEPLTEEEWKEMRRHPEYGEEMLKEIGEVDILLIPVGGVFTIEPEEAKKTIKLINPRVVIPMHYRIGGLSLSIRPLADFTGLFPEDIIIRVGNEIEFYSSDMDDGEIPESIWVFSL